MSDHLHARPLCAMLANKDTPVRQVRHADLERSKDESLFRSWCPACKYGQLMVVRDQKHFHLLPEDRCTWCAQRFYYTDLDTLPTAQGDGLGWKEPI